MPLVKSSSKKAFSANVEAELAAGKPRAQSLAIAYSVQRKAGGNVGTQKYGQTTLDTRMESAKAAGGGIQSNAHPEMAQGTKLGNPVRQIADWMLKIGQRAPLKPRGYAGK